MDSPRCVLVPCPRCGGRPIVEPLQQKEDPLCPMCAGVGEIDPEFVCDCGRPALLEMFGRGVCLSLECAKRAEEASKKPAETAIVSGSYDADAHWEQIWGGMY